jgi:hypothetical protein
VVNEASDQLKRTLEGVYSGSGSDFAEWCETQDGETLPCGTLVGLSDGKVFATTDPSKVFGVVRPPTATTVIGGAADTYWHGMFLKDDFGGYVLDGDGNKIVSPDYNPVHNYVPRSKRPGWVVVGVKGFVVVDEPYFEAVPFHWRLSKEFAKKAGGLAREYCI